ncbi:MAG: hypothetical protein ACREME_08865, partial [Gemmatimonadales bacterium]
PGPVRGGVPPTPWGRDPMIGAPPHLTIRELKVHTAEVLLQRPVETASGMVFTAPLVGKMLSLRPA